MKKIMSLLIILVLMTAVFAACTGQDRPEEDVNIRIAGLKGPTSMGMVQLMSQSQNDQSENNYTFSIHATADEVTPKLIQGELDMAAIPANLAAVLYNNTQGQIQVLAVNTLGVLYITELGDSVQSLEDLRGQTIYASGKGSVPEFALRHLLAENGIDPDNDVNIEFRSEPAEIVALLSQTGSGIAMLPQPYIFVAQSNVPDLRIAIDLNEEWNKLDNNSMMITGVIVARTDFVEEHPEAVAAFLEEYEASTIFVNTNVEEAAQMIEDFDIFQASVAQKAIPYCNITFIAGEEMKTVMEGYLNVLFEQNPRSVGEEIPDAQFYFSAR